MTKRFSTIHWGVSGWTALAGAWALCSSLLCAILLGLIAQTQHNLSQALTANETQAYELRMVPTVARLCRSYWRLEDVTGVMGSEESDLCNSLMDHSTPLIDEFEEYTTERLGQ